MKALVTGASGSIGSNLVHDLLRHGHEVRAFVRPTSNLQHLEDPRIEFAEGDVLDPRSVQSAVAGCNWVFHAAAMYTYASEATDQISEVSCSGTQNIIEAASHAGVDRVILTSSSVTAGYSDNPHTLDERSVAEELEGEAPYVVSKVRQERLALETADELGVDLLCVCPTMSVGPCGNDLGPSNAIVITYLEDPLRMTYPGGCNIVSVRDVARGHVLAAGSGIAGEKYLLGSENLEWPEIHTMISELCGVDGPNIKASHTACFLAAAGEEVRARLEKRQPRTTRKQALMLGRYYWYDHGKAAAIGYQPRPARQALAEAIAWLAASSHMSRELRTRLRLSREVYEARNTLKMAATELQPDHALV